MRTGTVLAHLQKALLWPTIDAKIMNIQHIRFEWVIFIGMKIFNPESSKQKKNASKILLKRHLKLLSYI